MEEECYKELRLFPKIVRELRQVLSAKARFRARGIDVKDVRLRA